MICESLVQIHVGMFSSFLLLLLLLQVAGDLGEESDLIDPTNNKYEVASQLIIHLGRR